MNFPSLTDHHATRNWFYHLSFFLVTFSQSLDTLQNVLSPPKLIKYPDIHNSIVICMFVLFEKGKTWETWKFGNNGEHVQLTKYTHEARVFT